MPSRFILSLAVLLMLVSACGPVPSASSEGLNVLATETFLADIAQNVAGQTLTVQTLIPLGVDPHGFEATPSDLAKVAHSQVLIVNGAGFEAFLDEMLANAGGERQIIEASKGLKPRHDSEEEAAAQEEGDHAHKEGDPHFWLDPQNVIQYVRNIQAGLSQADPEHANTYAANAEAYIVQLKELDKWIASQVETIPPERRLLVTNHESLGYFADRYGFKLIGAIIPSAANNAAPSAQNLAALTDAIRQAGAPAIFLETGVNPQLAEQLARETGIKVVVDLYTHSITAPGGDAPSYLEMMRYNTRTIIAALNP